MKLIPNEARALEFVLSDAPTNAVMGAVRSLDLAFPSRRNVCVAYAELLQPLFDAIARTPSDERERLVETVKDAAAVILSGPMA